MIDLTQLMLQSRAIAGQVSLLCAYLGMRRTTFIRLDAELFTEVVLDRRHAISFECHASPWRTLIALLERLTVLVAQPEIIHLLV